jgi:hypothetical protein
MPIINNPSSIINGGPPRLARIGFVFRSTGVFQPETAKIGFV